MCIDVSAGDGLDVSVHGCSRYMSAYAQMLPKPLQLGFC